MRRNLRCNFLDFAFACVGRGIRTLSPAMNHSEDRRARRFGEQRYFFYLFRKVIDAEIQLNDDRPLTCRGTLNHGNALRKSATKSLSAPVRQPNKLRKR